MSEKFLRVPAVVEVTGYCRSSLYARMAKGDFPKPYQLGGASGRAIGWKSSDIEEWMSSRVQAA